MLRTSSTRAHGKLSQQLSCWTGTMACQTQSDVDFGLSDRKLAEESHAVIYQHRALIIDSNNRAAPPRYFRRDLECAIRQT